MLVDLHISGLGSIREAHIEFAHGLNVISGETGAGKTMLLNALSLVSGARSDTSYISHGLDKAQVQAIFDVTTDQINTLELDIEFDDVDAASGEVYARRVVQDSGKSRAYLQGIAVPSKHLAALAHELLTVHGQSQQLKLRTAAAQREALDSYGGAELAQSLSNYQRIYDAVKETQHALEQVQKQDRDSAERIAYLQAATDAIADLDPKEGELEELQSQQVKLQSVTEIGDRLRSAYEILTQVETPQGQPIHVSAQLQDLLGQLNAIAEYDATFQTWCEQLEDMSFQLSDIASQIIHQEQSLDGDPGRIEYVNQRIADIQDLQRQYGETVGEVLAFAERANNELFGLLHADQKVAQLEQQLREQEQQLAKSATILSTLRVQAGEKLSAQMNAELRQLAMAGMEFKIALQPLEASTRYGTEAVHFQLRSGSGQWLDLAKTASGGELSRIMLALELCLRAHSERQTFIFDEVDAGVGGQAGIAIGARLAELAKTHQVIVVTHLPQVAAYGQHHFVVVKDSTRGGTVVNKLTEQERVTEIARMLAGDEESNLAHAHAVELIARADVGT